jgi:hypothetical protein
MALVCQSGGVTIEQGASVSTIELDLANPVFEAHRAHASGKVGFRKRLRLLSSSLARPPVCWRWKLQQLGIVSLLIRPLTRTLSCSGRKKTPQIVQ